MFWGHADTDTIQRAYDRLVGFYNRHTIPLDPSVVGDADGWNRQIALAVNRMLSAMTEPNHDQPEVLPWATNLPGDAVT